MDATLNGPFGPVSLSSSELTIGRAPDNKLIINDVKASSHHAHIRFSDGTYRITDLGSTNGTFVNGQRLVRNMSRTLLNGDTIRIGDAPLSFTSNDGLQIGSTVYAPPSDNNLMPATAAASEPLPVYQQSQVPPVPPVLSPPYTPQSLPGSYAPASVPSLPPLPPSYAPVLPRKSRRGLWIILAIVAAVLILAGAIVAIANSTMTSATPTPGQTLDAFCSALKNSDDHTAYMQFSPALQSRVSEPLFTLALQRQQVSSCSFTSPSISGSSATAIVILTSSGSAHTQQAPVTLVQGSDSKWKIDSIQLSQ